MRDVTGVNNPFYGRKHSVLAKAIVSYKNERRFGKARGGAPKGRIPWCAGLELVQREERKCEGCDVIFRVLPSSKKRFCSRPCASKFALSHVAQPWNKGKPWSEEIRAKISAKAEGRQWKQESREKVARTIRKLYAEGKMVHADVSLDKNPNWRGGRKYFPYHPNFNYKARRLVRERDSYTCALCGQYGNLVHHIDNDKENPNPRLITLCFRCHGIAERHRETYRPILSEMFQRRWLLSES